MTEFDRVYQQTVRMERNPRRNVYEIGMRAFEQSTVIAEKEGILLRLISLYPKEADIYFKMAGLSAGNAIVWHNICFSIDPCHIENIIAVSHLLYSQGLGIRVFDYVSSPVFARLLEDPRFLAVYSRCNFQQLYYKNGVAYLQKLIEYSARTPAKSDAEKIAKWSNYHDLGYVYCIMGDIEMALKYTQKAVDLADKFGLDMGRRLLSFSNTLCYRDYTYLTDSPYLKINDYLPEKMMFSMFPSKRSSKKIRVGYVSSDFAYHAVANFIVPILENHDRSQFEIILYANQPEFSTDMFIELGLPYRLISEMTDEIAARMIYKDSIDILIDLNGHTVGNRLGIFRYRPAAVQITYLGYANTTGLKSIQYRITDGVADPVNTLQPYSEKLVRLPSCFLLYKPFRGIVPVKSKLCSHPIILGAINKENKNTKETLAAWAAIMAECPSANILIKLETFDNIDERREFYMNRLRTSSERIIILPKLSNPEYNNVFSRIDIMLDTFPFSGTTTTCNALFHSVPVVSLSYPNLHVHNVSASILKHSGLDELVASSVDEYISIVKRLVENPEKISEYKRTIHWKFRETIMDSGRFMKGYEATLRGLLS